MRWHGTDEMNRTLLEDISYAPSARTRPAQAFIRTIENATGRRHLLTRARDSLDAPQVRHDFWRAMMQAYGLKLDVVRGSIDNIPETGPLVMVANHPFGILDGLVMGYLLDGLRGDFRILAHSAFQAAPEIARHILPIDFSGTRTAEKSNLKTRADAIYHLQAGGAVGIFPGGTVSTAQHPFCRATDPQWRLFSARMIQRSGATVVPIWFDGANSRLFQLASRLNYTLRMALLMREFKTRMNRPVRMAVGQPITPDQLARFRGQPKEMMDFLRAATYGMADTLLDPMQLGYEFEGVYRH